MTTTANRPAKADDDNDWSHGPVAAPFNIGAGALLFTTVGRVFGIPPWVAFLMTAVMVGAVVWSGLHHQPRPLSRMSITFRAVAVVASGGWMWFQLATFPDLGLASGQATALVVAWPATILVGIGCFFARRMLLVFRIALPGLAVLFTSTLTLVLGQHVVSWLHNVLFVTDRIPLGEWAPIGAWIWTSVLQLLMFAAPLAVVGRHTANREESLADAADRAAAASAGSASPQSRRMLAMVCDSTNEWRTLPSDDGRAGSVKVPNLSIEDVRPWKNGAGETYVLDLTKGRTEIKHLRTYTGLWATKLALPLGCGIEVLQHAESRGKALVQVNRVNVLKQTINYPELLPRSILDAIPLGKTRYGKEIGPFFRQSSCFLWGQKGSGKTGTIFDIIAGALQCTDCLVWVIDLNGGAAAMPFLRPWADGKVDRPCIDWVASTLAEVRTMTEVGLKIALDRKLYYKGLKYKHNTNLMPVGNGEPGAAPPEILIVIDEGATVLGIGGGEISDVSKQAKHNLNQIMDLARDAAVNIVFSGLRATADVADTAFKAGTSIRIGMRVTDQPELAHGFGRYDLDPADIPEPGSGFICCGHDVNEVEVFKAYYLDPARNYTVGVQTTPWRPYMDERGLTVGSAKYANRWQRTAPQLWEPGVDDMTDERLDELCSYGAVPVTATDRADRTDAGGKTKPVSGIQTDYYLPPTGEKGAATFSEVMEIARQSREQYLRGQMPDEVESQRPAPASGGPGPAQPDPGPGVEANDEQGAVAPDDDMDDEQREPEWERRFRDLANQMNTPGGVLPTNPEDLRRNPAPVPLPPDSEIAVNPRSPQVVERILKAHGPVAFADLLRMLNAGGSWGPATKMSNEGLRQLLLKADWLAPREKRDPYNHRDNAS